MTKAKLTRIPKRVLACVLAVLMVLSCLTMLPFTGFAATPTHAKLESPAVVQDDGTYYAFGNDGVVYKSSDMASWNELYVGEKAYGYLADGAFAYISNSLFGDSDLQQSALDSPEVVNINGEWYLYLSIMDGSRSMIVVGTSSKIEGPYDGFKKVLETGFNRGDATDVLQSYFGQSYSNNMPQAVKDWGKGTCYYYSNFLGLNYQWFTEELPRAYAPSITQYNGEYYMAYGYRNGGIWLQKLHKDGENAGLVDFTWSGGNWNNGCDGDSAEAKRGSENHYLPEDCYDTDTVDTHRLDPYFGQLIAHTTEGGDTDTLESSVSRAGEEPELYAVGDKLYLQVTYGGADNGDGYNVRSYKHTLNDTTSTKNGAVNMLDFKDMNGESGVDNADASMIGNENSVKRTGLKLMGDYNLPGTPEGEYYTSPGASSVTADEDGMLFYNYQVKTNYSADGTAKNAAAEMRSHILLHSAAGDPLVTPFEYTGSGDATLYNDAYGDGATQYDIDNDIVGQYYVTMTGNETSASVQNYGGITLTSGGLVSGMISGTWDFEETAGNTNLIVIHDEKNDINYHGALLKQTVESEDSLGSSKSGSQQMTFTLVGNNQTVWGVWYDKYEPAGENNANAHLSISPAIYTGGALDLNADYLGQLGLKYGNYIAAFGFANIDYSTYLTIDENYSIESVRDQDCIEAGNHNDNIVAMPVANADDIDAVAETMYYHRQSDAIEVGKGDGADTESYYDGVRSRDLGENGETEDGAKLLKDALQKKLDSLQKGQKLYVLTGWLDSDRFGRTVTMDDDKGDVELLVTYKDTTNDSGETYSERVYSHVYQQPVPANISGANYIQYTEWLTGYDYVNTTFLRAEGSYPARSTFPGTDTLRNYNMRGDGKQFAAASTFSYYNESLFRDDPDYGAVNKETYNYFHGNRTSIMNDGSFNTDYRSSTNNADITVSYEQTFNAGDFGKDPHDGDFALNAGPRAEYYIDKSSPETSNIASYYRNGQYTIPLYYSTISTGSPYNDRDQALTFNYYTDETSTSYSAGLYDALNYGVSESTPVGTRTGSVYNPDNSDYPFKADFSNVEFMYDGSYEPSNGGGEGKGTLWNDGKKWSDRSYSANIWITADSNDLANQPQNYNTANQDDYNFYVRTRVDSVYRHDGSPQQLVTDMEYGIYITDKTFLRTYYDQVMEDKLAQGYTYYSWENFRDATRLIADYLNNYMELADSVDTSTYGETYDADTDYQTQINSKHYDQIVARHGTLLDVLKDSDLLDAVLNEAKDDVQGMLCYLLTAAEEQLFAYDTYQNFKDAYSRFDMMLKQMNNYTTSSWKAYINETIDNSITLDDGTIITFKALNAYLPEHNDKVTDTALIYDPSAGDDVDQTDNNYSWKIIYDGFFGGDAAAVFEQATEILEHAASILQRKADYDALDAQMEIADTKYDNVDTERQPLKGSVIEGKLNGDVPALGSSAEDERSASIFDIDRSTVNAIANSNSEVQGDGNDEIDGQQYTVSSLAAFDKIYDAIWEIKTDTTTNSADNDYLNDTSIEDAVLTDRRGSVDKTGTDKNKWYSDKVRDDQQYYMTQRTGTGEMLSTVQEKINDRVTWVQRALEWLEPVALEDQYQTFDYLIDVISTIDFNAYTPEGQQLLWDKLYELLVEGGVYAVNQQLFSKNSMLENKLDPTDPLTQILYNNGNGEGTYYTGWNATNVDAATTELMTLLTELDETQRKTYTVNFTVQYMNIDGTESNSVPQSYTKPYNTPLDLSIEGYDPNSMYAYSWVVKTYTDDGNNTETVSNLRNIGSTYTYNSNNKADITVYVTRGMADPSTDSDVNIVPVVVTTRLNQRNEVAMNLSEKDLGDYSVNVNGDTLSVYNTDDASGEPFAVVTANQLPYHTFNGWRINYKVLGDGTYTLAQLYDAEDGYITISNSYTLEDFTNSVTVNGKDYAGDSAANGYVQFDGYVAIDTVTYGTDMPGNFYAWLITGTGADTELKIAAYTEKYSCNVPNGGYDFVQVNSDKVDGETVYYIYDAESGYIELKSDTQLVNKGDIQELDTNSLYYRLDNHLRDSWSSISEYDATSSKVSLYSHFTAAEDVPEAATVVESGCVAMYVSTGTDAAELNESLQIKGEGVNKFVASSFTSVTSEGQYMMSISFPSAVADTGYAVAMRSFVTYSYMGVNEKGEYGQIYRTVYSDVKLADLTTTAE